VVNPDGLKGWDRTAQGNALGIVTVEDVALKGRDKLLSLLCRPFRADCLGRGSQGVALGYPLAPWQGWNLMQCSWGTNAAWTKEYPTPDGDKSNLQGSGKEKTR